MCVLQRVVPALMQQARAFWHSSDKATQETLGEECIAQSLKQVKMPIHYMVKVWLMSLGNTSISNSASPEAKLITRVQEKTNPYILTKNQELTVNQNFRVLTKGN